jgi:hypothetical protein
MAAPVYGPKWYEHSEATRLAQDKRFQAAVMSARAGSDEAVKQVGLPSFLLCVDSFRSYVTRTYLCLHELKTITTSGWGGNFVPRTLVQRRVFATLWRERCSLGHGREIVAESLRDMSANCA